MGEVEISDVPDEVVRDLCVWTPANHMPVTFITPDDLTDDERAVVPRLWLDALACGGRDGMRLILDEWERVLPWQLPTIVARFRAAGTDLLLGRQLGVPVLIYLLTGHFGDRRYCPWIGTPPVPVAAVPDHLRRLPADVLAFHTGVHDWLDSPLNGGMLPFAQMELVSFYYDPSWPFEFFDYVDGLWSGPLDESEYETDWSQVVVVHNNRASTRICAVRSDDPGTTQGWCWMEGSMTPEPNIWQAIDEALERGAVDWSYD